MVVRTLAKDAPDDAVTVRIRMKKPPTMKLHLPALIMFVITSAGAVEFPFELSKPGNVSFAVYDSQGYMVRELLRGEKQDAGKHASTWDGLDRYGQAMPPGEYEWRLLRTPGFQAEYLLSVGTNPKSAPYDTWVGNHSGPSAVHVDAEDAMYVGADCSENAPVLLRQSLDGRQMAWNTFQWDPMFGANAIASSGGKLIVFSINRTVRVLDLKTGNVLRKFDVPWPGTKVLNRKDMKENADTDPNQVLTSKQLKANRIVIDPFAADLAANEALFAVSERDRGAVRWFSVADGREVRRVALPKPTGLAMAPQGDTFIISAGRVVRLTTGADAAPVEVIAAAQLKNPRRLALDAKSGDLFVTHGDPRPNQVSRFSREGRLLGTFGKAGGRVFGRYVAEDFYNIGGIAGDGTGGFLVTETGEETFRRVAHFDASGKLRNEWHGGQAWGSFVAFDPEDPAHLCFNGGKEVKTFIEADFKAHTYRVTHVFRAPDTDGLFPTLTGHHCRWEVRHRDGRLFLVNAGGHVATTAPAIFRVDADRGELVPVARAGVLSPAQSDDAPGFWVKAVKRLGVEINKRNFSRFAGYAWSDRNGNGRIDPEEVEIGPAPEAGGYTALVLDAKWNVEFAGPLRGAEVPFIFSMPNEAADGEAPRWNWVNAKPGPARLPAEWNSLGRGQEVRGLFRSADGSLYLFAKGNGNPADDRQGDTWPGNTSGAARLSKWDAAGSCTWTAGNHASVNASAPAQFHDPRRILGETHDCIVVQDRVIRPAQVFTKDGLYAGYLLEAGVDDGLPREIYHTGAAAREPGLFLHDHILGVMHQSKAGEVFWNPSGRVSAPVYRIHGWNNWERQNGKFTITQPAPAATRQGSGLRAAYFKGADLRGTAVLTRTDPQLWFGNRTPAFTRDTSGRPWLDKKSPAAFDPEQFAARWTGEVEAPFHEEFRFLIEHEQGSTVRLWLDGKPLIAPAESAKASPPPVTPDRTGRTIRAASAPVRLEPARHYPLRIEYVGGGPAPQMHLEWESFTQERQHIPGNLLYPSD